MAVHLHDLDACLDRIRRASSDPVAGLYGPTSIVWRVGRENLVFLGGGRAALLQLAHPFVAHAIEQHSNAVEDPLERFHRTFENVYAMIFGDLRAALAAARRVYGVHAGISGVLHEDLGRHRAGSRYHANHRPALKWVYSTLIDGAVQATELVVGPLSPAEKERYWQESRLFAGLFGLTQHDLPPTWGAFREEWHAVLKSEELCVGSAAERIGHRLLQAPNRRAAAFFSWYRAVTASLMPPRFRVAFGLRWGRRDRALAAASIRALRAGHPWLPARVRYVPAYVEARRRLFGRRSPDRVGRALERAVVGSALSRR